MVYSDQLTTIIPYLPPAVSGVGDYGFYLAKQLRQDFGLVTDFILGKPDLNRSGDVLDSIDGFLVKQVARRSPETLLELLPSASDSFATVLLHYVGYGYAKRGCPVWLMEGLERWRGGGENRRLVTMFHEIYARPDIRNSQFWTSWLQKRLAIRLIRLSDRCLTSKQGYANIIADFSQGKHGNIPTLPVFSNVGERSDVPSLAERPRRLVVFGGGGWRTRVYGKSRLALERTCRELEIEEIIDIGPDLGFEIEPVKGIPVTCGGVKPAEEISTLLSSSVAGFFDYPREYLAKSTIFSAYCAHKLLPVGVSDRGQDVDGLEAGKHYWVADRDGGRLSLSAAQKVADNAYAWYQTHNLSVQARAFADCLMASAAIKQS